MTLLSLELKLVALWICADAVLCDDRKRPPDKLQVFVRHGERYPVIPVPELENFKPGSLTPKGMQQARDFGQQLSLRYSEFLALDPVPRLLALNEPRYIDTVIQILDAFQLKKLPDVEALTPFDVRLVDISTLGIAADNIKDPTLPDCLIAAKNTEVARLLKMYPANLSTLLRKLVESQFLDTIDTLIQMGYKDCAFGVNISSCIPPGTVLMTRDLFGLFGEFCRKFFCKDLMRTVLDELRSFSQPASPSPQISNPSVSIYALSDVAMFDLLETALPQFNHTRPNLGASLIFETRGDDVSIVTGANFASEPELMVTVNIYQLTEMLRHKLLKE